MSNTISCRIGVYQDHEEAYRLLSEAGVDAIEAGPPAGGDYAALKASAEAEGLAVATIATGVKLGAADSVAALREAMEGAASIGTPKMFVSIGSAEGNPHEESMAELAQLCDEATELGVTLSMETHPPYGTNADLAVATIAEVGRPGLGYNFDTANIYYYNEGTDSVTELKKCLDHVPSVHLKDTDGLPQSANFPVLGQGVVDFPEVFRLLGERGFTGPYTLEIEGEVVSGKDLEGRHQIVVDCMEHLRSIGAA